MGPPPRAGAAPSAWNGALFAPGIEALRVSCARRAGLAPDALISRRHPWAGRASDWGEACRAAALPAQDAATALQGLLVPVELAAPSGKSRLTAYYEPVMEVRLRPEPPFTEPLLARPSDLEKRGERRVQRLSGGGTRPYPARRAIRAAPPSAPIAYGRLEDVYFLQIQGSGQVAFPDGRRFRAAFAAHNGHRFKSLANHLKAQGVRPAEGYGLEGMKGWLRSASPAAAGRAVDDNPRYVFFALEPLDGGGPKGAEGVGLTPLGSIAVDRRMLPLGVPFLVAPRDPVLPAPAALMVSQDTGGAVEGVVRADLYFGTGEAAGRRAARVNTPGRMWMLLPPGVADRLEDVQ